MALDLELSIVGRPSDTGAVWKKMLDEQRYDFLQIILKDEGVNPDVIAADVINYNGIYNKGRQIQDNYVYKYLIQGLIVDKPNPTQFERKKFIENVMRLLFNHRFSISVILDKKKYYNDRQINRQYYDVFNKILPQTNKIDTLPQPYLRQEFDADIGSILTTHSSTSNLNDNPLSAILSRPAREVIRFADIAKKSTNFKLNSRNIHKFLNSHLDYNTNDLVNIGEFNPQRTLDTYYTLDEKINIVGLWLVWALKYTTSIGVVDQILPFDSHHFIQYLLNERKKGVDTLSELNRENINQYWNIGDDIGMIYNDNYNDSTFDRVYNYLVYALSIVGLLDDDANTDYHYYLRTNYITHIIQNKPLQTQSQNNKPDIINVLTKIYSDYFTKIILSIKRIIYTEFEVHTHKEYQDVIGVLNKSDIPNDYKKFCTKKSHNYSTISDVCKGKSTIRERIKIIQSLIKIHNIISKSKSTKEKIEAINLKLINDIRLNKVDNDIWLWYMNHTLTKSEISIIRRLAISKQITYQQALNTSQRKKVDEFINSIESNRRSIKKFYSSPVYTLRAKYDTLIDTELRFRALKQLYENYTTHTLNDRKQYVYIHDPNLELVCEHELILFKINTTYKESLIDQLWYRLSQEFYDTNSDNTNASFINCRYCGRQIIAAALTQHSSFSAEGVRNAGYTKQMGIIDRKILKQIEFLLNIALLVFKDRLSYNITPNSVYSSVADLIKSRITPEIRKNISLVDPNNPNLGRNINQIISSRVFGKIIFEVANSKGNIYPRGKGNKEFLASETNTQKIVDFLIDWSIRKMSTIPPPLQPYTRQQLHDPRIKNLLLSAYKTISKRDKLLKVYSIPLPPLPEENTKFEESIKKISSIVDSGNKTNYINNVSLEQYNKLNSLDLRPLIKYQINTIFNKINHDIKNKFVFKVIKEGDEFNIKNTNFLIKHSYYDFIDSTHRPAFDDWWDNINVQLGINSVMENVMKFPYYEWFKIGKKMYSATRINGIVNRLDDYYGKMYRGIVNSLSLTGVDENNSIIINYYSSRCLDNTPHKFYDFVCVNCGQTIKEVENPSDEYFKLMKKIYSPKSKSYEIIQLKELSNEISKGINTKDPKLKRYLGFDLSGTINRIVKFITKYRQIDDNKLKTKTMQKYNANGDTSILVKIIMNLGRLTRRYNEEKQTKKISSVKLENKYNRLRLFEINNFLKQFLVYYSILMYNKNPEDVDEYELLVDYQTQRILVKEDIQVDVEKINEIIDANNLSYNAKVKIVLSILVECIANMLFKNPSIKRTRLSNSTLLANFGFQIIDLFLYLQRKEDITETDLERYEMEFDLRRHKKARLYLDMTMEEKIESGIQTADFETQEKVLAPYIQTNFNIGYIEPSEENVAETTRRSVYDDGINMGFDFDFTPDDDTDMPILNEAE